MTSKSTTRRPADFTVGDTILLDGKPTTVVRLSRTVVTVRWGSTNFELNRRDLRRTGSTIAKGRRFTTTAAAA